jgi:hypothetical protein
VIGSGDFNGDGRTDFAVRSSWGLGIIGIPSGQTRLRSLWMAPWGTNVGQWTLNAADTVGNPGRYESASKHSLMLRGAQGFAILNFGSGAAPPASVSQKRAAGERFLQDAGPGHWAYRTTDVIKAETVGDYDGDGFDSFVVQSDWGFSIIGRKSGLASMHALILMQNRCQGLPLEEPNDPNTGCHGGLLGSWKSTQLDVPLGKLKSFAAGITGDFLFIRN